jgi:hypothetical protein
MTTDANAMMANRIFPPSMFASRAYDKPVERGPGSALQVTAKTPIGGPFYVKEGAPVKLYKLACRPGSPKYHWEFARTIVVDLRRSLLRAGVWQSGRLCISLLPERPV